MRNEFWKNFEDLFTKTLFAVTLEITIMFITEIWFLQKSLLPIFANNYENYHLCGSIKLWWFKMIAKSPESSKFWIINVLLFEAWNPDSVGVNSVEMKVIKRLWVENLYFRRKLRNIFKEGLLLLVLVDCVMFPRKEFGAYATVNWIKRNVLNYNFPLDLTTKQETFV